MILAFHSHLFFFNKAQLWELLDRSSVILYIFRNVMGLIGFCGQAWQSSESQLHLAWKWVSSSEEKTLQSKKSLARLSHKSGVAWRTQLRLFRLGSQILWRLASWSWVNYTASLSLCFLFFFSFSFLSFFLHCSFFFLFSTMSFVFSSLIVYRDRSFLKTLVGKIIHLQQKTWFAFLYVQWIVAAVFIIIILPTYWNTAYSDIQSFSEVGLKFVSN